MGFASIAYSLEDRRKSCISSRICTGILLLLIAGADCWPWGSDPWCPPGPEPQCPINPVTDIDNYFDHPTDCHYYIQCDGSRRPICRRCSPATYFSPKVLNCVWPLDAACEHNDTTRAEILQPPICGPDRCVPPGMKKRDYSDCTHYFICINETFENRKECPSGQHFNTRKNDCEDQCKAGCQNPCHIPGCPCPRTNCVPVGDPSNCQRYRDNCTNTWEECEGELKFNPKTLMCEDPCQVDIPGCPCPTVEICVHVGDPYNCQRYRDNCTNTWKECEGGLKFNPQTLKCEDPCQVDIPECPCQCDNTTPPIVHCKNCAVCEVCRDGQTMEEICPNDLSNKCPGNKCCALTRHETDCQIYYNQCSQTWSRCPGNLHFNQATQTCDHPCNAGCQDRRDIRECCPTEGEVYEDPCSCEAYYSCRNGIKELVKCENGQQYNRVSRRCDSSCSGDCPKLFAGKPECCASTSGKPEPQCPTTTYPIFLPHPSNARYFYQCLNGVRSCNRCPFQHRWNTDTDTCDETHCPKA